MVQSSESFLLSLYEYNEIIASHISSRTQYYHKVSHRVAYIYSAHPTFVFTHSVWPRRVLLLIINQETDF